MTEAVAPRPLPLLMRLLVAVQFLTRLPVWRFLSGDAQRPDALGQAMTVFPLAGALVGLVTAGVFWLALQIWPVWIAVLVALAGEALLTGALHEDAVADFCDAFGGGRDRGGILRILKDSRIGSFGMVGLALALGLRAAAMGCLPADLRFPAIVAAATLGRWLVLPITIWLPPLSGRSGLARDLAQPDAVTTILIGAAMAIPGTIAFALYAPAHLAGAVLLLLLFALWLVRLVRRRLGGVTGDVLGFACYAGQVLVLLLACARL